MLQLWCISTRRFIHVCNNESWLWFSSDASYLSFWNMGKPTHVVIDSSCRWEYGFWKYTNNIKPIPIRYVSSPLSLSLSLSFILSFSFVIVEEVGWSPPPHPTQTHTHTRAHMLLHIHFVLNWWIKLSLAQNQSWLAFPYSFTLDNSPSESKSGKEREEWEE